MSNANRPNRKGSDADILRMNSVGLSLGTIAKLLDCHPTSVTLRLRRLGVPPADTRRTFMEDIFVTLSTEQQEWLADWLETQGTSIKDFVRTLLVGEHQRQQLEKQPK